MSLIVWCVCACAYVVCVCALCVVRVRGACAWCGVRVCVLAMYGVCMLYIGVSVISCTACMCVRMYACMCVVLKFVKEHAPVPNHTKKMVECLPACVRVHN